MKLGITLMKEPNSIGKIINIMQRSRGMKKVKALQEKLVVAMLDHINHKKADSNLNRLFLFFFNISIMLF
jgi:hypothetical protein